MAGAVLYVVYTYAKQRGLLGSPGTGPGPPPLPGPGGGQTGCSGDINAMLSANPNILVQIAEWQAARRARGENPRDWNEFRAHVQRLGAPDPGPVPPPQFCQ